MTIRPLIVGVDSSTQSCKVEVRTAEQGRLLGRGSAPHPPAFPPSSEQDPQAWWTAFVAAFGAGLADAGARPSAVVAIAVAAQCHGLVALDGQGRVLRPAKLWNDTTSTPDLTALRRVVPATTWAQLTGSVPTAAFTIAKLAWLAAHEPEHLRALGQVLLPHDYLTYRLTGRYVTDRSDASGTGYFDASTGRYLPEILTHVDADIDWPTLLPTVLGAEESAGLVAPAAAEVLGLSAGTVIGPGGGDQHASALGLGVSPGDVTFAIGTSGVVFATSEEPVQDREGMVDGVADMTGGYLPLVSTLNAARVTDAFAGLLDVSHDELADLALAAPPTTHPVLVPYLDGERKPDLPDARGLLAGITSAITREELARAAFEGVLLGLLSGLKHLRRCDVPVDDGRVLLTGGGAHSSAFRTLLADLLGREVCVADPSEAKEATARGACVQAAAVLHSRSITDVRDDWRPGTTLAAEPRSSHVGREVDVAYAAAAELNASGFA